MIATLLLAVGQALISSRDIAFQVLVEHADSSIHIAELLERHSGATSRDNMRLAAELVYSTVRRRATLDAVVAAHVRRPPEQVERNLWCLLRIGACQLILLETPSHAAVHETVETGRRCGNPRWTGFVNGTLRSIARTLETATQETAPGAQRIPVGCGEFIAIDKEIFPTPEEDMAGYLAAAFSFPRWMVERWLSRWPLQRIAILAEWFNTAPRMTMRANALRGTREELQLSLIHI